jgi:MFS superfamily sulfate permease-like transporter
VAVNERVLALAQATDPAPHTVVLDVGQSADLDVATLDALGELIDALARRGAALRLAEVRAPALELLRRAGLAGRAGIDATLDAAVAAAAAEGAHHPPG